MKISDETHEKLQRVGRLGETYDDVIKLLLHDHYDFENIILQVKLVGDKRQVHLKHPMYYWTPENYDAFLRIIFDEIDNHQEWRQNILRRIAGNDRWYGEVKEYRNEVKEEKAR